MNKKVLLMILDGWGVGKHSPSNVIYNTPTPYWDSLLEEYPHSQLLASGEDVGLPHGQMGNSEVGHLNIGAGRVVYQDLVKINIACRDNSILKNKEIVRAFTGAKESGKKIHFMGLVSDGGVHSSLDHLFKLCDISKEYGIADRTYVHCFMDGRDTDPHSGKGFIEALQNHLTQTGGNIASIIGRYYAMDRDKRWERVKEAYDLLVEGKGVPATDMVQAMQNSYDAGKTDEFVLPIVNTTVDGKIEAGDTVIFFNYRNDRAKELTIVLTQQDMPEFGMKTLPLEYFTMTPYDSSFKGLHILFDKENVQNTLGEVVAKAGLKQLRIAETEKYAHVTFFFSGGRETEFDGEERVLIPSPKVATYDLKPEMSVYEVADALASEIKKNKFDLIVANYANGDMVGHTGIYEAIQKAVTAVDAAVKTAVEAAKETGYDIIIIADHGNADNAVNADGSPNTAHSLNPVPFVFISDDKNATVEDGILADVAPSVCYLLGVEQPEDMTGHSLIDN
ncbi:MAG: 2,3-bisphosphoglycerate-independent phosphoglycerate mutase [Dysgonamonadaceae bacterium]|jgi:2,3-bisphosphoglycerate-independent phosphoglycerate mutase|nr:2,3-bisphosphoglycerate-independent phosphoglycerate mutase [Dysgonamonadaceae bacterium]